MSLSESVKPACVVLAMKASDNAYGDDGDTYIFPQRYLSELKPLSEGSPMLALIYEPRRSGGRASYVAWSRITSPPTEFGKDASGQKLWAVQHEGGLVPLPRPVKLEEGGQVFESMLRQLPKDQWGPQQRGKSVRYISFDDFCAVLAAAGMIANDVIAQDVDDVDAQVERKKVAVTRLLRDRGFRLKVLSAYGWRCAVTGWSSPPDLSHGLLDAAHILAVGQGGSDGIRNGISLTSSVHRLFDAGALNFEYADGLWRLVRNADLGRFVLDGPGGQLSLQQGQPLLMPHDVRLWPDPSYLRSVHN
ncbi:HNH endonuclease [Deinococcus wulumuqiensis]